MSASSHAPFTKIMYLDGSIRQPHTVRLASKQKQEW